MLTKGRRYTIAGLGGLLALSAILVALRVCPSSPSASAILTYPPNARQLIAAGLTGRPAGRGQTGAAIIDLVLVDGTQTTVLFHAAGGGGVMPSLTLRDDAGRLYQPSGTSMSGSGLALMRRPAGWQGALWYLLRALPFLGANQPAKGYASFASLPATVRGVFVQNGFGRGAQAVRVRLRLTALRTMVATADLRRTIARQGIVVTLRQVVRGAGSAQIVYMIDAPPFASGPLDGVLRDGRGRELSQLSGSTGTCGMAVGKGARMRCDETALIAPPPTGTLVRLIVTKRLGASRGAGAGTAVVVPFTMP